MKYTLLTVLAALSLHSVAQAQVGLNPNKALSPRQAYQISLASFHGMVADIKHKVTPGVFKLAKNDLLKSKPKKSDAAKIRLRMERVRKASLRA